MEDHGVFLHRSRHEGRKTGLNQIANVTRAILPVLPALPHNRSDTVNESKGDLAAQIFHEPLHDLLKGPC